MFWRARDDARESGYTNRVLVELLVQLCGGLYDIINWDGREEVAIDAYSFQLDRVARGRLEEQIMQALDKVGLEDGQRGRRERRWARTSMTGVVRS